MIIFSIYQIILLALSAVFIIDRTRRFLKKEHGQTIYKLAVTYVLWLGVGIVALYPNDVAILVRNMGLGENFNTLIFLVFVVVFILIFKILGLIEKLERQITELVRKEALKEMANK